MKMRHLFSLLVSISMLFVLATAALAQPYTPDVQVAGTGIVDDSVTIVRATMTGPGWVVIHASADGAPGPVIGYAPLVEGVNTDVVVTIDADAATPVLYAMLHVDEGTVGTYEFPGADGPVKIGDAIVQARFSAFPVAVTPEATEEVMEEATPEATEEAMEEATPEATEEAMEEATPEATEEAMEEATPEATEEAMEEATPEATEEAMEEATPEATEEAMEEATPEATEEAMEEATPEATEEAMEEATPEATEEAMEEATPEATEEAMEEATPEATEEAMEEATAMPAAEAAAPTALPNTGASPSTPLIFAVMAMVVLALGASVVVSRRIMSR